MHSKNAVAAKIVLSKERKSGKDEAQMEIAKNAILEGFSNEIVAKITGLTIEQIEELRK